MKKLLLLLLFPLLGLGCQQNIGGKPLVKIPKEKIISYQVIHYPEIKRDLLGANPTSTQVQETIPARDEVEYNYVSSEVAKARPYWDKENSPVSSAEFLPKRNDGKEPIAFYAKPKFYREDNIVYDVKFATATLADFQRITSPSLTERVRSIFFDTAVAVETFTASSTYNPGSAGTLEILVIGGGGGGGQYDGGGGGAGEFVTSSNFAVTAQEYTVTVGAGGAGGAGGSDPNKLPGVGGGTSTFGGFLVASGGGGGGSFQGIQPGQTGASGGGAGHKSGGAAGGTGTAGFDGGLSDGNGGAGGGGGAGGAGGAATAAPASGAGGHGVTSTISGVAVCYAGGGGGGRDGGVGGGTATCGGGAGAVQNGTISNGTDGKGAGGGGGGYLGGGRGGDGVVILIFTSSGGVAGGGTTTCAVITQD